MFELKICKQIGNVDVCCWNLSDKIAIYNCMNKFSKPNRRKLKENLEILRTTGEEPAIIRCGAQNRLNNREISKLELEGIDGY